MMKMRDGNFIAAYPLKKLLHVIKSKLRIEKYLKEELNETVIN